MIFCLPRSLSLLVLLLTSGLSGIHQCPQSDILFCRHMDGAHLLTLQLIMDKGISFDQGDERALPRSMSQVHVLEPVPELS